MPSTLNANANATEARARERFTDLLARCYHDPDLFNRAILDRPAYCDYQRQWCRDIVEYRCLAIETGNQVGKDYWIAGVITWWLWTRKNSLVIVTGPGQSLLGSVTWKEVRRAITGAPVPMGARISAGIKTSPHTVTLGNGWQALGYSTQGVERASGQHAGQLLVIVEEASGVEDETWSALESLGFTILVAIGNPLRAEGGFVDLCNQAASDRSRGVPRREATCHRNLPSTASPHAMLDRSPVGLADRTWIDACARKYGPNSLWYRCHVGAIRPTLINEQLIPPENLDRCITEETAAIVAQLRDQGRGGRVRATCDVGEGVGNSRTVIFVLDDLGELDRSASRYTGPRDAAAELARLASKWGVREDNVSYDGAGQTGKRLGNCLAALGYARARAYFGSSGGGRRCTNLRTACALGLARRLDPDHYRGAGAAYVPYQLTAGADWESMREELLGLRYHLVGDSSALEAKEDYMDRLGRSPDFADSLCQGFRQEAIEG
jgi:hypothetical protein